MRTHFNQRIKKMTSIVNNAAYNDKYLNYMPGGNNMEYTRSQDGSHTTNGDKVSVSNDRVTLSRAVAVAKTKESMGHSPTGHLKRKDIEEAVLSLRENVETAVASHLGTLGFNPDLNISLILDNENNIVIKENFPGKVDVEESLNNDSELLNSFKRLSSNNEFLSYTANLQNKQISIADFLYSNNLDENRLMSLTSRYEELKNSDNPLETLLSFSRQDTPYTYIYNPESEIVED